MASPSTPVHPARYLALFLALLVGVYLLVFLTGDKKAEPKLGIDLQGGTRVTLTARTPDGSKPTPEALNQAQQIIASRVNGLGVSGSEVVIDGDNLVITVPGTDGNEARNLGQTARLYIRPVIHVIPAQQPQQPAEQATRQPGQTPPAAPPGEPAAPQEAPPAGQGAPPGEPGPEPGRAARRSPPPQPRPYPQAPPPTPAPRHRRPRRRTRGQGPCAAHRRREGTAAERRTADSDPGAAVPGHSLQRGRHPRRQRRSEPAAGDLLDRPQRGVSAGQVDHQR